MVYQILIENKKKDIDKSFKFIDKMLEKWVIAKEYPLFFKHLSVGRFYPDFIDYVEKGQISRLVCSASKTFWNIRKSLDKDIIDEFLGEDYIIAKNGILINEEIYLHLKKYLGKDMIRGDR